MTIKNKHACRLKISEAKIRQIVGVFAVDLEASQIAAVSDLTGTLSTVTSPPSGKKSPAIERSANSDLLIDKTILTKLSSKY